MQHCARNFWEYSKSTIEVQRAKAQSTSTIEENYVRAVCRSTITMTAITMSTLTKNAVWLRKSTV